MNEKSEDFYTKYKDYDVTFNQEMIDSLGMVTDQISFKCGEIKVPCIVYSSTMMGARLIAKLEKNFFDLLREHRNTIVLRYTFKTSGTAREISFIVHSKLKFSNAYDRDKPDFYYLFIDYINGAPNTLIDILGNHIETKISSQKRTEERIILYSDQEDKAALKIMENYLFIAGKGVKCILTEISIFSAKVLAKCSECSVEPGTVAMLIMKAEGLDGVGEMMGNIERVEPINKEEGFYSVIISFDQERIPPSYKMWIADCIEMIKIKK